MIKRAILLTVGLAALAVSSQATSVAWVSFHSDPGGLPSTNAAAAGFTQAPDIGFTDLLTGAGYDVTRIQTQDVTDMAAAAVLASTYNGYDLVIVSRSVNSGNYQQEVEYTMWNQMITSPVIDMSGYTLRNSRLGYTTGTAMPDSTNTIRLTVSDPGHPIFAGLALDGANTMLDDYAGINGTQRGISVNTDAVAGGGTVLATVATAADPTANGMIIGEWQVGATMATVVPTTLGGHRLVFLSGSREQAGVSSETAGVLDLTPVGESLFLNAVGYMAIPEPTTLALVALGGVAVFLRRRRA